MVDHFDTQRVRFGPQQQVDEALIVGSVGVLNSIGGRLIDGQNEIGSALVVEPEWLRPVEYRVSDHRELAGLGRP